MYSPSPSAADFFTHDPSVVARVLAGLDAQGNEDTLLALDIAADLPFGPAETTQRVIAVFTDEPLENGVSGETPVAKIPELRQKLAQRKILLFLSAPSSPAYYMLGQLGKAQFEEVDGGDGLKNVDFKKLLAQMAKSISVARLQEGKEPSWQKALFGQENLKNDRFAGVQDKSAILRSGEIGGIVVQCSKLGVLLDVSPSMTSFLPQLKVEIATHFSDACYREEGSCVLSCEDQSNSLQKIKDLIANENCDGIYWFSDFQDNREPQAVIELRNSVKSHKAKLFIRSIEQHPQDLIAIADESGGGYKNGTPSSFV